MAGTKDKTIIAVMGPTASGKSNIAFAIAKKTGGEIISADSRQVYRQMHIATAQPSFEMLSSVQHHFVNILEPEEEFSAGEFAKLANRVIENCFSKNILPIVAGGSGLYIRALTDGFHEEDIKSPEVRAELTELLKQKGKEHMYEILKKIDPESASKTSANFTRRVFRAVEVYRISGRKLSELQKTNVVPEFQTTKFALRIPREILYDRINKRVYEMIEAGLMAEVQSLLNKGYHYATHNSVNTVGIKEAMMQLEGKISYDEMISMIQQNTRRYAKRQMTWLRKEKELNWIDVNSHADADREDVNEVTAAAIIAAWKATRQRVF